jgi:regulation of enolase protein 1 (concanavalin A-like superfamily)
MCRKTLLLVLTGLACLLVDVANGQVSVKINFQSRTQGSRDVPQGYLPDYGDVFGDRGNGYSYGWSIDRTGATRDRDILSDQRYDTNNSLRLWGVADATWEIALPNGDYDVYIVGGDPGYMDQTESFVVEGVTITDPSPYPPGNNFDEYSVGVTVNDGRLTIAPAPGSFYVKICFIHIVDMRIALPVSPANHSTWASTTVKLEWLAGITAIAHDVYIGTDLQAVTDATTSTPDIYKGRFTHTNPDDPNFAYPVDGEMAVEPGKTYYWRIDEWDGQNIIKGQVTSFTVQVVTAFYPNPVDGGIFVDPTALLSWSKGANATVHMVYFGTDYDSVLNATTKSPEYKTILLGNTTSWDPPGDLTLNQTYYWRIDERDSKGAVHAGQVWSFTVASRTEGGLKGQYFGTIDLSGDVLLTRVDPQINFDWGSGAPGPNVPADGFSVRWTGQVDIPASGEWTFFAHNDDGARLWIDEQLLIDVWPVSGPLNWHSGTITLEAGMHSLRLEFFDVNYAGHIAICRLAWQGPLVPVRDWIPEKAMTPPFNASNPQPPVNATDVKPSIVLSWTTGDEAAKHNVYFGTSYSDVNAAEVGTAGIYRGQQDLANTQFVPGDKPLEWGTTYYWRIDEINNVNPEGPWRGGVWHFTTGSYASVDDMESYTDDRPNRIFETWRDQFEYTDAQGNVVAPGNGTGMTVGVDTEPYGPERTIIHSGRQSLPLTYDNSVDPYYSETDCTFAAPQDWTVSNGHALKTLSLWYRGYPQGYGSFSYDAAAKQYSVIGSGNDIWNNSDQFHYVYMPLAGNGSMTVKVESVENTNDWAKGGIMIRQGLSGDAVNVCVVAAPSGRVSFQTRTVANTASASTETGAASITLPVWLRLTRDGDTFTGEYSTDGTTWQQMLGASTAMVPMSGDVYIGLVSTSHVDAATLCTSVFSNVTVEGTASSLFTTSIDVGIQVNDPAPFYVALQSGTSPVAVQHPDGAAAVLVGEWTEWPIPLSDFVGVDLAQVRKMIIGTGDKTPGGTGKLFIDDVRLYGE